MEKGIYAGARGQNKGVFFQKFGGTHGAVLRFFIIWHPVLAELLKNQGVKFYFPCRGVKPRLMIPSQIAGFVLVVLDFALNRDLFFCFMEIRFAAQAQMVDKLVVIFVILKQVRVKPFAYFDTDFNIRKALSRGKGLVHKVCGNRRTAVMRERHAVFLSGGRQG